MALVKSIRGTGRITLLLLCLVVIVICYLVTRNSELPSNTSLIILPQGLGLKFYQNSSEVNQFHQNSSEVNITQSTSSLLEDMRSCSLVLGVSQKRLDSNHELLYSLAKKGAILLSSIRTLLPSSAKIEEYRNPCWRTNYTITQEGFVPSRVLSGKFGQEIVEKLAANPSSLIQYEDRCLKPECTHCLPYIFLAAFPKCGTTTLAEVLNKHPQIATPCFKEPQWWARLPLGDMSDSYLKARTLVYLRDFKTVSKKIFDDHDKSYITYDGSQSLMVPVETIFSKQFNHVDYCALAAVVSRVLPDAKFILAMRDPAEALYSAFFDFQPLNSSEWPKEMQQNVTLYFHNNVKAALGNFEDCLAKGLSAFECDVLTNNWEGINEKLGSHIYVNYLLKWTQFFPIKNFLILRTEDFRNPAEIMRNITDFLSIDPVSKSTAEEWFSLQHNSRSAANKQYGDMMPETRKLLTDFYAPYNKQLADFLKDNRFLWSQTASSPA